MLLYIHVPFCQQKCAYCAFYSLPLSKGPKRLSPNQLSIKQCSDWQHGTGQRSTTHPLIERYCQTLAAEIALRAPSNRPSVSSVFFGGGTPSLLSSRQVGLILNTLQQYFSFSSTAEITMEANPESAARPNWLHEIHQKGVNRLSLGVQSLSDDELALLGRGHTAAEAENAVNLAHQAHFSSISLDLMWGIPHRECCREDHHRAHWFATLQAAIALSPHHISAYGLILEEGTPLAQKMVQETDQQTATQPDHPLTYQATQRQPQQHPQQATQQASQQASRQIVYNDRQNRYAGPLHTETPSGHSPLRLPTEEEEAAMYREGITLLQQHGYAQYEISNFALSGHQCRHNLGYWQGQDYYGFGPAAVSTLQTARFANIADFHLWAEGIDQKNPAGEQETLTPILLQEEKIMLSLRMTQGLAVEDWNAISSLPLHDIPLVQQLLTENLATFNTRHLALTPAGMMVSNAIISRLFENIPS